MRKARHDQAHNVIFIAGGLLRTGVSSVTSESRIANRDEGAKRDEERPSKTER